MKNYFLLLRPWQWVKNLLVFVPVFFAREFIDPAKVRSAGFAFVVFCLVASSMYVLNDILDAPLDRQHHKKRERPIASGRVSITAAIILSLFLLVSGFLLAYVFVPTVLLVIGIYVALNFWYSRFGKHVAILDVLLVASFYLLRIEGGGFATGTFVSRWLVLCTIFVALFIIIGKRRAELNGANIRPVLAHYSNGLLDVLLTAALALTVTTYSIYCVLGTNSPRLVYSVFFVILGCFRYVAIMFNSGRAEFPERILYTDKIILGSVMAWGAYMVFSFYF